MTNKPRGKYTRIHIHTQAGKKLKTKPRHEMTPEEIMAQAQYDELAQVRDGHAHTQAKHTRACTRAHTLSLSHTHTCRWNVPSWSARLRSSSFARP